MATDTKDEGLIKDSIELVLKEFQTLVTLFYLLLIALGMIFNYYKYAEFGINIFQYSTIFDFLIAPFKEDVILGSAGFALLMIAVSIGAPALSKYIKIKVFKKETKKNWIGNLIKNKRIEYVIIGVAMVTLFLLNFAQTTEGYTQEFKANIATQEKISVELLTGEIEKGQLIGKTESYIFLYQDSIINILPVGTSVKKIILP